MASPKRRLRICCLWLGVIASFAATLATLTVVVERAGAVAPPRQAGPGRLLEALVTRMRAQRAELDRQVVIVGDSMLLPERRGASSAATIPARLERYLRLAAPATRLRVYPFAQPGAGYSVPYFVAGRLARAVPDVAVIEINPGALARARRGGSFVRAELVAFIGADRLGEALSLPLYRLGITADRLLWLVGCVELGCEPAWAWTQRWQLRVAEWYRRERTERGQRVRTGRDVWAMATLSDVGPHGQRFRAPGYANYAGAIAGLARDDVALQLVEAAVRRLTAAGIETLVYVTPINVEHMASVGVYSPGGMRTTVRHLADATRAGGGRFVDLHALLGDEAFRDAAGHLTPAGPEAGVDRVARSLSRRIAPLLAPAQGAVAR